MNGIFGPLAFPSSTKLTMSHNSASVATARETPDVHGPIAVDAHVIDQILLPNLRNDCTDTPTNRECHEQDMVGTITAIRT